MTTDSTQGGNGNGWKDSILNRTLEKKAECAFDTSVLVLRQAMQGYSRGLDILKQVEKELGVPAGYEAIPRLHEKLSVGSRIKALTLRDEMLRFKAGAGWTGHLTPSEPFKWKLQSLHA